MKKSPSLTNVKAASIPRNISLERLDELGLDEQVQEGAESQVPSANDVRSTHLNHFAITLANRHRILPTKGKTVLIQRLSDNVKVLRQAYDSVQDAITQGRRITSAEEWLVDNFWLITEQIHMAKKHLPPGYSKEMPKLANTELAGLPRIYGLVLELISLVNAQITQENIFQFVKSYQSVAPLNIGEVWGIPIMLRLGLLENIRRVCDDIIAMRKDRNNADQWADKLLEASDSKTVIQVLFTMSQTGVKISNAFVLQILQRLQGSDPLLSVITTWLEQNLSTQGLDVDDINRAERHANHVNLVRLRNSIISLRFVNVHSWKEYAEEQSYMESILRKDPSGIYAKQDFETRDACRHAVEGIAAHNKIDEQQVATAALELATQAKEKLAEVEKTGTDYEKTLQRRKAFIGYYLLTPEGNFTLRSSRGYKIGIPEKIQKSLGINVPVTAFLTSISIITLIFSAFVLGFFHRHLGSDLDYSSSMVMAAVSALVISVALVGSQLAVSLTNQLVVHTVRPSLLPRMDFMETGIPDEHRSMVVVPTMLTSLNGVKELLDDLRARYLVNRDKNLYWALITDFGDAKTQTTPNDDILLSEAVKGIEELNALYPNTNGVTQTTFYLFHRPRIYNASEGVYMGYERKRGKLTSYTNLLRGGPTDPFQKIVGDLSILNTIQYVITLDTDTMLPSDSARKLVGNASHILNKPLINPKADRVVGGYGLLQPRVSVGLNGAFKSYYALINSLDSGLDPYTKYVSDVYQDAFGEGSFIGKGLYHVDAFHQVFSDRFPENRILSHDLLEGCYVRSALVSDVELIEEYPSSYLTEASRRHRWVRGDWQIASWILPIVPTPKGFSKNPLSVLSKWKIFDNLRRSLVPLAMVTMLAFGWLSKSFSTGLPLLTTLSVFSVFLIPMTIDSIEELIFMPEDTTFKLHISNWGYSMTRRAIDLAINLVFLPFEAYNNVDAVLRCLARLFITRRLLLQWVTSTSAASAFAGNQLFKMLRVLWVEPIWAIGVSVYLVLYGLTHGVTIEKTNLFLYNSLHIWGLLLTWMSCPIIGWYLSKPLETIRDIKESPEDLTDNQKTFLRVLARKTWRFFEVFVRKEDNYLPLDNFQEFPKPMYARRTSPTNIAMGLLTNISAWDFGYITAATSIDRIDKVLATLLKMERFRGHFYNWYDTADLRPLLPKYVSAVDSGNLVGYLIILRTALLEFVDSAVLPKRIFAQGIHDNILVMRDILQKKDEEDEESTSKLDVNAVSQQLKELKQSLEAPSVVQTQQWVEQNSKKVKELIAFITKAVESKRKAESQEADIIVPEDVPIERIENKEQQLLYYANAIEKQLNDINSEITTLLPWILSLPIPQSIEKSQAAPVQELVKTVAALTPQMTLRQVSQLKSKLSTQISLAKSALSGQDLEWLNKLDEQITVAANNASARIEQVTKLADVTDKLAEQDFSFLYNPTRNLIAIGFNVDHNRLDNAYYDTFCSEARLCSFAGIARGQFPVKHWFSMSRLLTTQGAKPTLLSWSGSMFEYLMPLLVMKTYPGTLLDQTYYAVVMRQIEYGQQKRVPWGISESAYNMMDAGLVYQYGPFGVPGLGLKRGLSNDLVVAPYASAMALMILPVQSCKNLQLLTQHGLQGIYGMYEACDYTPHRLRGHMSSQPIQSYFSHHSGMSFLSMAYTLLDQPMQKRFDATPEFHANELLLQEKIPRMPYISNPNEQETSRWMSPNLNAPSANRRFHGSQTSASAPEVHLLSNGNLHVMATTYGGGYINYEVKSGRSSEVVSITRWKEDVTVDGFAIAAYIRDMSSYKYWTTTSNPIKATEQSNYSVMFSQGKAEYRRTEQQITSHTTVTVSPYDDVEVRRITVKNDAPEAKRIEVTSYGEIVLGHNRLDAVHRAFATLFVKTEVLPEQKAILAFRKPRSGKEKTYYAFHIMLLHDAKAASANTSFETDRNKFVGRGHGLQNPEVMSPSCTALSNTAGYPLDPIFGIRQELNVAPGQSINVDFVTGAAATREEALKIIQKYQKKRFTNYVVDYSWISSQKLDFRLGITAVEAQLFGKLAGCLLYSNSKYRASPRLIAKNRLNQSGLWRLGISGDNSIILVRIGDVQNIELIAQCLQAHTYFRANGLVCDLIIWNDETSSYRDDLQSTLLSLIASSSETSQRLEKPGGIYPIRGERLTEQEGVLLYSVARVVLSDTGGRLVDQINRHHTKETEIPKLIKHVENYEPKGVEVFPVLKLEQRNLILLNNFGGFDKKLREYVIQLQKGQPTTPAPWVNILANEHFGTVISEKGSSYTWYANAHEYRLTPWNNDPVLDESGEAYYIRDENTGKFWSPLPQPCPGNSVYMCRHGMGYSIFEHLEDGIRTDTTVFVPQNEPVKVVMISIRNNSGKTRKLSVTGFVEWTLGELRDRCYPNVVTDIEAGGDSTAIVARNPYHLDFFNYVSFFMVVGHKCTFTANRSEFIGFNGTLAHPAAMDKTHLSGTLGAALDPCAALNVPIVLEDGKNVEVAFVLGASHNHSSSKDLIERIRSNLIIRQLLKNIKAFWNHTLNTIQVETPDPALDVLANGWLLYQVLSARIWGRTGFYQSSGAFGFRDQLQDAMALNNILPNILRQQIVTCCEHQFEKGDVLHWWHPQSNRGVRTTFSDDYLWLPMAVTLFVESTGDKSFLDFGVRFVTGIAELSEGEESRFDQVRPGDIYGSVYEHCKRAIKYGMKYGVHGIPLMGCGDWNDGMNLVGIHGKGESVWLAFFLIYVMDGFTKMCEIVGDTEFIQVMKKHKEFIMTNIEKHCWDGEWYVRAFFDNGTPLGSKSCDECKIDSLPQSWGLLSKAADPQRARIGMESAYKNLVRHDLGLVQLFSPCFDKSTLDPGYIKGYAPGVRENGGQYTHAAIWLTWAFTILRDHKHAWELFDMLNPINHTRTLQDLLRYRVEPYVIAADVYTLEGHEGQGGWTWYTGSAGWMYRLIMNQMLGIQRLGDTLTFNPLPRKDWKEFKVHFRQGKATYHITFKKIENLKPKTETASCVNTITVDGELTQETTLHVVDDQKEHDVIVELFDI